MPWFDTDRPPGVLIADLAPAGEHLEDEAEDDEDDQADGAGDQRPGPTPGTSRAGRLRIQLINAPTTSTAPTIIIR